MFGELSFALSAAFNFDRSSKGESTSLSLARLLLRLTILVSALYLLQRYTAFPFSSGGRFLFIACTLAVTTLAGWRILLNIPIGLWILGLTVAWAGMNTYLSFGPALAIAATSRFANVMVIAPLAALLFVSRKSLNAIFLIYLVVFSAALLSLLYQFFGGSLQVLVQDYIAIRADLVRHMTIVGEPNVGGMIAVLGYIIGLTIPRNRYLSVALAGSAIAFVIMSLSKGAVLGICVASFALFVLAPPDKRVDVVARGVLSGLFGVVFVLLIGADAYLSAAVRSVFGQIKGEPSAVSDFANRQWGFLLDLDFLGAPIQSLLVVLFGSSFGVAGSAAQELLGYEAGVILPHNSYLEMLLTGGIAMLGCTIYLMGNAFRNFVFEMRISKSREDCCAVVCLVMLACWMLIYPVIYEPVTGALFWSLIGYGNRIYFGSRDLSERNIV